MMKIPMYFGNQFISYCDFPDANQHFDFEITLEEVITLFGKQNTEEIVKQAKRLSETTTLTFQEALNQIIEKELK